MVRPSGRRRRALRRLLKDDPASGVHALPDDVRGHHARAHHGRVRRAEKVLGVPALHGPLGDLCLRSAGALGLGRRRLAQETRRARLRGWDGRPHLVGHVGVGLRDHAWQAPGLRPPADAAPQPADDGHGRVAPVVRLVRLQRGQRARGQRARGERVHRDQHGRGRRRARLDVHRVDEPRSAASAFTATNTGAAAAALGWMFTEWMSRGKPTVLGAASGAVAGLVAITPASGFVGPISSLIIGAVAGAVCYTACNLKGKLGYDDSLDVVGVHAVGGTWGALATGLFASKAINEGGDNGLFFGNPGQVWIQVVAVLATYVLAVVGTAIILKVVDALVGLRVSEEDEVAGLDLSQHSETAYAVGGGLGEFGGSGAAFGEARPRVAH